MHVAAMQPTTGGQIISRLLPTSGGLLPKMVARTLLISVVPMLILAGVAVYVSNTAITNRFLDESRVVATAAQADVSDLIDLSTRTANLLANLPNTRALTEERNPEALTELLLPVKSRLHIDFVNVRTIEGQLIAAAQDFATIPELPRALVRLSRARAGEAWAISDEPEGLTVHAISMIRSLDTGDPIGILETGALIGPTFLRTVQQTPDIHLALNWNGVVRSSTTDVGGLRFPTFEEVGTLPGQELVRPVSLGGEPYLGIFSVFGTRPDSRGLLGVLIPTGSADSANQTILMVLGALVAILLMVSALADFTLAHQIVGPIRTLQAGAARIGSGTFDQRIEVRTGDELEALAASFNVMATQLEAARERMLQLNLELEQRVDERTADLAAAYKELEAFSYTVSHDLRAPLRGIEGFSQVVLKDYGDQLDERGQQYLRRVRAASQRMEQLIDAILGMFHLAQKEIRREPVNLTAIAEALAVELQQADPDRKVSFVIEEGLATEGDPDLLRIALQNLIGNAWKFTSQHPTGKIELGSFLDGVEKVYFVRDDGAGFDMEYADKLFLPFGRLHDNREFAGEGVGLASVQRIVAKHDGRVWGEAAIEAGATLYFTLAGRQRIGGRGRSP